MYYSDRDGSITQGMVTGALRHFYENLQSFWPISQRPIFGLNDRVIQLTGICIGADSNSTENSSYLCSNSSSGVSRSAADTGTVRNAGKSTWKNFSSASMSPNAANTGW